MHIVQEMTAVGNVHQTHFWSSRLRRIARRGEAFVNTSVDHYFPLADLLNLAETLLMPILHVSHVRVRVMPTVIYDCVDVFLSRLPAYNE